MQRARHRGARGRDARRAVRADQRRRGHVPRAHLREMVLGVQQAPPGHPHQLPAAGLRRRHQAGHRADGLLRRDGRADDAGAARGGAGQVDPPADGARGGRAGVQPSGRHAGAEVRRPGAGEHLPRQGHEVERSLADRAQSRRDPAGHGHRRRPPVRRVGDDVYLGRLSLQGLAGVQEGGRRGHGGQVAGRGRGRQKRRRRRHRQPDARRARLRRADLRDPDQDRLRAGEEPERQVREGVDRLGGDGGGRRGEADAG